VQLRFKSTRVLGRSLFLSGPFSLQLCLQQALWHQVIDSDILHNPSCCLYQQSSINTSDPVALVHLPSHDITTPMFDLLLSLAINAENVFPELCWLFKVFLSKVQSSLSILQAYAWLAPCSEPSGFTFTQSFLHGRLGSKFYPLESVLWLKVVMGFVFFTMESDHRSFHVAELSGVFYFSQIEASVFCFPHLSESFFGFYILQMACLTCIMVSQQQL